MKASPITTKKTNFSKIAQEIDDIGYKRVMGSPSKKPSTVSKQKDKVKFPNPIPKNVLFDPVKNLHSTVSQDTNQESELDNRGKVIVPPLKDLSMFPFNNPSIHLKESR